MADEEHLRILQQGGQAWYQWRREYLREHLHLWPDLRYAKLGSTVLRDVVLHAADFSEAHLSAVDLTHADLSAANFTSANLKGVNLTYADLSAANFTSANLIGVNLTHAYLTHADLSKADLSKADLSGAYLERVNFSGANLRETNLSEAIVGRTVFGAVDLSETKGLESVAHVGPSTIGIDTIYQSQGQIPEVFLRGAGLPDKFITYIGSLVGRAIEYYSCFISYSSKDQGFAEQLHADLQAKGVRCWFAPEEIKIGDKIWDRLDQSIRLHDKLLLILSSNSIGSEWVEDEVSTAFEEERRRGRTVLFPVRVDDAVFATRESWAAKVRQRHIGEFSNWKDHDAYKEAFDRLLRDLKAETPVATAKDE